MKSTLLLKNCKLYNSEDQDTLLDILIEGNSIINIAENISHHQASDSIIDVEGRLIAPGFIDVHIQGAGSADILHGTLNALENISKTLARLGTTSFLGTTIVKPDNGNQHLRTAREYVSKDLGGATLLGFHIEGPFININKRGGLVEECIYEPSPRALDDILNVTDGALKMITIAPEIPGNLEIIKRLTEHNVIASFGHSDATYEETKKGFDAGINHVTHIFNAMPPLHHRNPGPLGAIFEHPSISAQIISDGHHLHPSIVHLLYKVLGSDRCICITDGMQAMGLPEGKYLYNGKEYESKSGVARYLDGTLIGTTMSLGNIALQFKEFTNCSLATAIDTISKIPAQLLGIYDKKGAIEVGKDADLVIFDNDFSIYTTLVCGRIAYTKQVIN